VCLAADIDAKKPLSFHPSCVSTGYKSTDSLVLLCQIHARTIAEVIHGAVKGLRAISARPQPAGEVAPS
jgi:hypothetical protein